jgi:hypothetical protein
MIEPSSALPWRSIQGGNPAGVSSLTQDSTAPQAVRVDRG